MILAEGERIGVRELPANVVASEEPGTREDTPPSDFSLRNTRRSAETELIQRALRATGGNRTHAARLLQISHRALLYKLKEYGIRD